MKKMEVYGVVPKKFFIVGPQYLIIFLSSTSAQLLRYRYILIRIDKMQL